MPMKKTSKKKSFLKEELPTTSNDDKYKFQLSKKYSDILDKLVPIQLSTKDLNCSEEWYESIKPLEATIDKLIYIINLQKEEFGNVVALAQACTLLALIYMKDTTVERLYIAEMYLWRSLQLLKGKELNFKAIVIVIKALNELCNISSLQDDPKKATLLCDKILKLYFAYTERKEEYSSPLNILILWKKPEYGILDKLCIKTLLSVLYHNIFLKFDMKSSQIDKNEAIMYTHKLLKKLLNRGLTVVDYIEWAISSTQLSVYLRMDDRFTEARSHLIAAACIMEKFYEEYTRIEENESSEKKTMRERYDQMITKISLQWAKYGITLFRSSKYRLLRNEEEEEEAVRLFETSSLKSESSTPLFAKRPTTIKSLEFSIQNKDVKSSCAITDEYILNYNDAKAVFTNITKHLNKAKASNSDQKSAIYVEIIRTLSVAYKYLTYYAPDMETMVTLQRERIKALEDMLKQFKSNILVTKHIWFEIAIGYSSILDIKIGKLHLTDDLSPENSKEVSELVKSGMRFFQLYLNPTK